MSVMTGHRLRSASMRIWSPGEEGIRERGSEISILSILQDCLKFSRVTRLYPQILKFQICKTSIIERWKVLDKRRRRSNSGLAD